MICTALGIRRRIEVHHCRSSDDHKRREGVRDGAGWVNGGGVEGGNSGTSVATLKGVCRLRPVVYIIAFVPAFIVQLKLRSLAIGCKNVSPLRQSQAVRIRWEPVGVICWFASSDWKVVGGRSDRYQARGNLSSSHSSIRGQEVESSKQGTEGRMGYFSFLFLFLLLFPSFFPFFPFFSLFSSFSRPV